MPATLLKLGLGDVTQVFSPRWDFDFVATSSHSLSYAYADNARELISYLRENDISIADEQLTSIFLNEYAGVLPHLYSLVPSLKGSFPEESFSLLVEEDDEEITDEPEMRMVLKILSEKEPEELIGTLNALKRNWLYRIGDPDISHFYFSLDYM